MTEALRPLRSAAGAGLAVMVAAAGLAGCALIDGSGGRWTGDRHEAWLGWLSGGDLRNQCDEASLDHFRLSYQAGSRADLHVLEVTTDPLGAGEVVHRAIHAAALATTFPPSPDQEGGERQLLAPPRLGALLVVLERLGMLSPNPWVPAGGSVSWMIAGCLDGSPFFNSHSVTAESSGVPIRTPGPGLVKPFAPAPAAL